jgi:hypothetical protein
MELLLISAYIAICIVIFSVFRIPLNRWTVPTASIGGTVLVVTLVQFLNYYHPYSGTSRQYLTATSITPGATELVTAVPTTNEDLSLVAWFHQNGQLSLSDASVVEVTFDNIPGKVFSGKPRIMLTTPGEDQVWTRDKIFDGPVATSQPRMPVLIEITDPDYNNYLSQVPAGSHAQAVIYGEQFQQLALVRKTLLRMSAWMNYLSFS